MPQFTVNASRLDPYKNFKFRVIWDGRVVAGISHVSALVRTTEVVSFRNGGDPSTGGAMPGQTEFEPITLERGVTHDLEFERWANKVWNLNSGLGAEVSLKDFRKDVRLELLNEAGQLVLAYLIFRCWVSDTKRCRNSTRMPTVWRSSRSSWKTKAGNATSRSSSRSSPDLTIP